MGEGRIYYGTGELSGNLCPLGPFILYLDGIFRDLTLDACKADPTQVMKGPSGQSFQSSGFHSKFCPPWSQRLK